MIIYIRIKKREYSKSWGLGFKSAPGAAPLHRPLLCCDWFILDPPSDKILQVAKSEISNRIDRALVRSTFHDVEHPKARSAAGRREYAKKGSGAERDKGGIELTNAASG